MPDHAWIDGEAAASARRRKQPVDGDTGQTLGLINRIKRIALSWRGCRPLTIAVVMSRASQRRRSGMYR